MIKFKNYLKLMRIKHYLKNGLIFLPLLFSSNLFDMDYLYKSTIGLIAFSFTASIVYIINDMRDIEKDKKHPKKKNRPLASGKVTKKEAIILLIILLIVTSILLIVVKANIPCIVLVLLYLILNLAYSYGLKNVPILDVAILASGFLIRLLFGSQIVNIEISNWLYLTVLSMSFFLALGKRRNEIKKTNGETREVLKYYTKEFLDKNMYMFLALTNVFYALWTTDPRIIEAFGQNLIYTVPLVIIICMKYSMIIESDSDGDPIEVVLNDKLLLSLIGIYGLALFYIIYI